MCLQGSWIGAARGGDDVNWQDKAVDADRGAGIGCVWLCWSLVGGLLQPLIEALSEVRICNDLHAFN